MRYQAADARYEKMRTLVTNVVTVSQRALLPKGECQRRPSL